MAVMIFQHTADIGSNLESSSSELVQGAGFEPAKSLTAELEPAPFDRSGTPAQVGVTPGMFDIYSSSKSSKSSNILSSSYSSSTELRPRTIMMMAAKTNNIASPVPATEEAAKES